MYGVGAGNETSQGSGKNVFSYLLKTTKNLLYFSYFN